MLLGLVWVMPRLLLKEAWNILKPHWISLVGLVIAACFWSGFRFSIKESSVIGLLFSAFVGILPLMYLYVIVKLAYEVKRLKKIVGEKT